MTDIRPAAVAGRFYPGEAEVLRKLVTTMLDVIPVPASDALARAYVVPHAGYRFSGPIAAFVYARLRRHAERVRRVVLLGPSHFVPLRGLAASPAGHWRTPLGDVPTPIAAGLSADAEPHAREHSLEVQLPFLQTCLPDVPVTPVAVGKSDAAEVADALDALVEPGTVLLCSTDLSHYHDEATAKRLDAATADAILTGEPDRIGTSDACGVFALRATVTWANRHGLSATLLAQGTSADTAGSPQRVVGYPAFSFA